MTATCTCGRAGGRAGDGDASAPLRGAPAPGQRGEERGGATVGPQVPGLQLLGGQGQSGQASCRAEGPCEDEGASPGAHGPERGTEHGAGGGTLAMYLRGWKEYFQLADTPKVFADLDRWIRHRLRVVQLKQWRNGSTVFRELRARGVPVRDAVKVARNRAAGPGMPECFCFTSSAPTTSTPWASLGSLPTSTFRTARCGPACPVVWEGSGGGKTSPAPIPIPKGPSSRFRGAARGQRDWNLMITRLVDRGDLPGSFRAVPDVVGAGPVLPRARHRGQTGGERRSGQGRRSRRRAALTGPSTPRESNEVRVCGRPPLPARPSVPT